MNSVLTRPASNDVTNYLGLIGESFQRFYSDLTGQRQSTNSLSNVSYHVTPIPNLAQQRAESLTRTRLNILVEKFNRELGALADEDGSIIGSKMTLVMGAMHVMVSIARDASLERYSVSITHDEVVVFTAENKSGSFSADYSLSHDPEDNVLDLTYSGFREGKATVHSYGPLEEMIQQIDRV